jgi:hypothetical protein
VPSPRITRMLPSESMDLSTSPDFWIDCERCGRPYDEYRAEDTADGLFIHEVDREVVILGAVNNPVRVDRRRGTTRGRRTGRHRMRVVDGRGNDMRETGKIAYAFECGCGHPRTISQAALRRKLVQAPEPRIRL